MATPFGSNVLIVFNSCWIFFRAVITAFLTDLFLMLTAVLSSVAILSLASHNPLVVCGIYTETKVVADRVLRAVCRSSKSIIGVSISM